MHHDRPMHHEVAVHEDSAAVALAAADHVAALAHEAVERHGSFRFAVSGGATPWAMFAALAARDVPWDRVTIHQVDERIAAAGDPDRNLTHLRAALGGVPAEVVAMPVEDPDPDAAADRYAEGLPPTFDLVHLGLGPDGHTASLVPDDPVLEVEDRAVACTTGEYQGRRRMTLTYPGLSRAKHLLWLVVGGAKSSALARLCAGDTSIPAGRVVAGGSLVLADTAAASELPLADRPAGRSGGGREG